MVIACPPVQFSGATSGFAGAEELFASMLVVVVGTVIFYGASVSWIASKLGLSQLRPSGLLIVGISDWAIAVAKRLKPLGISVLLVDKNADQVALARDADLKARVGDILSATFLEELNLSDIGHALCATTNYEVNTLAKQSLSEFFDRRDILILEPDHVALHAEDFKIRPLDPPFSMHASNHWLSQQIQGADSIYLREIAADTATGKSPAKMAQAVSAGDELPLFLVGPGGRDLEVFTQKYSPPPKAGATLLFLKTKPDGVQA